MLTVARDAIHYRKNGSAIALVLPSTNVGTAIALTLDQTPSPLETTGAIAYTPTGLPLDILSLPDTPDTVTEIRIGSRTYERVLASRTPAPGQYSYNPALNRLTIAPLSSVSGSIAYTAIRKTYPDKIPTTRVRDVPDLLARWNAEGEIEIDRRVGEHPRLTYSFFLPPDRESEITSAFFPGAAFTVWGIGYIVIVPPEIEYRESGWLRVTVTLEGQHAPRGLRSPLDRPTKLSAKGTIAALNTAGIAVSGLSGSGNGREETTTPRQRLETLALTSGGFLDYESATVKVLPFGKTPLHTLASADIITPNPVVQSAGSGATFQGTALIRELHNVRLTLESEDDRRSDERITLFKGDPNPQIPPNIDKNSLRSPALAFDAGGPTKTRTDITYLNGQPVFEEEQLWGYAYTSLDTHLVSLDGENLSIRFRDLTFDNYWKKVRSTQKIYRFNQLGYLEKEITTGSESVRFRTESDDLEMAKLQGEWLQAEESDRQAIDAKKALYEYFTAPIDSTVDHELASPRSAYDDLPEDVYYPARTVSSEGYTFTAPNPDSTEEEELPPLVVGKLETRDRFTKIVGTSPEVFLESDRIYNTRGPSLSQSASLESSELKAGRPGSQPRLVRYTDPPEERNPRTPAKEYRLNTPDSLATLDNPETLSFPGVSDLSSALVAARTLVAIENSKATTTDLQTRRLNYSPGDRLWWRGDIWWIIGINERYRASRGRLNTLSYRLELGKLLEVPVSLTVK